MTGLLPGVGTVTAMQGFVNLTNDWCTTCKYGLWSILIASRSSIYPCFCGLFLTHISLPRSRYGLGLFKEDQYEISARAHPQQLYMVGHAGTDWASSAILSSYNPHFGFGVALATNSFCGLNCSTDQPASEFQDDFT